MWTRIKVFVARLKSAWMLAGCHDHAALLRIVDLLGSDTMDGATFAVQKNGLDTSLKAAQNDALRAEAIQWASHWYKERHLSPHPWDVRMCVELAVGKLKGYL
jgi:hypothetical protein